MNNTEKLKLLKQQANRLPLTPGVYLMKNKKGEIIYVGKAKALKNRITQYFGSNTNHSSKVIKMVSQIDSFETILCDTEYEALMLENSLIKQHQPKYNILLKDDKGYHYVKVTNEDWPKILNVKNILDDGAQYIGPYYSSFTIKQTVNEAIKMFKIPVCNRSFDKKSKPCLNYHIGLCSAPCKFQVSKSTYLETINSAVDYIKNGGINEKDLRLLYDKMTTAANNLEFEYAAKLRDRINAIEKSRDKQKVIMSTYPRQDVFAIALVGDRACVTAFIFKDGHLFDKKQFFVEGFLNKNDYYSEILQQFYCDNSDVPPRIEIDCKFNEIELIERWLCEKSGKKVTITVPQKGIQKQLVDMCLTNSAQALSEAIERKGRETEALNELSGILGLPSVPTRIESYDISNMSGSNNVGAMVVFINGRPEKAMYRKFKIKSFNGQDDFRSLAEVLDRRFSEYKIGTDTSFKQLPDLILLDGGKGQLSAVKEILCKHNLNISVFGMVKDSKHKTRAITSGGEDIQIKANRKAFSLVTSIQDEVHRVAIGFHHQRAKNSALQSELTNIKGVGEATVKKLIKSYKTIKNIKNADLESLINSEINRSTAENIIEYFKKEP